MCIYSCLKCTLIFIQLSLVSKLTVHTLQQVPICSQLFYHYMSHHASVPSTYSFQHPSIRIARHHVPAHLLRSLIFFKCAKRHSSGNGTLFYMPHCPMWLYRQCDYLEVAAPFFNQRVPNIILPLSPSNLLWKNWGAPLASLAIIGNRQALLPDYRLLICFGLSTSN